MKSYFKQLYLLALIIYSGYGLLITREPQSVFVLLILSLICAIIYKIKPTNDILKIILIWIVYASIQTFVQKKFHPYLFIYNPVLFYSAFIAVRLLKDELISSFIYLIQLLAIISLFFFLWQITDKTTLFQFMNYFNINDYNDYYTSERIRYNIVFYTVNQEFTTEIPRNCGFCWEPGPFGCYVTIAIFFNLILNNFSYKSKTFLILLITLITTQSTTAFIIFFIIIIGIITIRKQTRLKIILIPILLLLITALFIFMPFLLDKIQTEFNNVKDIDNFINYARSLNGSTAPGRFMSLLITWKDFLLRPLLGYGVEYDLQWTFKLGANIFPVTGLGNILAQYGLFGLTFWTMGVKKSADYFAYNYKHYQLQTIWILLLITTSISTSIVFSPIFIALYFVYMLKTI